MYKAVINVGAQSRWLPVLKTRGWSKRYWIIWIRKRLQINANDGHKAGHHRRAVYSTDYQDRRGPGSTHFSKCGLMRQDVVHSPGRDLLKKINLQSISRLLRVQAGMISLIERIFQKIYGFFGLVDTSWFWGIGCLSCYTSKYLFAADERNNTTDIITQYYDQRGGRGWLNKNHGILIGIITQ